MPTLSKTASVFGSHDGPDSLRSEIGDACTLAQANREASSWQSAFVQMRKFRPQCGTTVTARHRIAAT